MNIYLMVLCWLAVDVADADAYTAAVWTGEFGNGARSEALSAVHAASGGGGGGGGEKADIMVLPSDEIDSEDYDEVVRGLSAAARQSGLYLVAPLTLRGGPRRGGRPPGGRTTLVFDRQGAILAVSRKAACGVANNTALPASPPSPASFRTDFGVTFSLLAEEQLVLGAPPGDVRNVVLAGACHSEIPYFNAAQFTASWAYTHRAHVLTARALVAARAGPRPLERPRRGPLALARLALTGDPSGVSPPAGVPPPRAQLARYVAGHVVRPVDLLRAGAAEGYSDTVCHNAFCCEFYVKTRPRPQSDVASYGLAAFDGAPRFRGSVHVGAQNCAVFACTGLYKRSCSFGSVKNSTNITFEKLTISANFSHENTVPYPVILSDHHIAPEHFDYVTTSVGQVRSVKMTVTDADSLLAFGAFGRVFERDYDDSVSESEDLYNYIFNDDVHEVFDYLWIRVRILMVIVSIYVLEMM